MLHESGKLIDPLAGATLDLFAADRELQHHAAALAFFFSYLGRRNFVDSLAARAFNLLRSCDELEHRSAVVTDQV